AGCRTRAAAAKSRALVNASALGRRPSTAAGATPAKRKRSAQKNWSPANGGHDGRHARACGGVRGPGAAVMDNRGGAREQPVVRRVADGEKVVRKRLRIAAAPAGMEPWAAAWIGKSKALLRRSDGVPRAAC